MNFKPNILLVEDNPGDIRLIREILNEKKISPPRILYFAQDGEIALQMLKRENEYSNLPLPDLILLDMNLPKKDGKTVLREIKQDNNLNNISIIILTASVLDIENDPYAKLADAVLLKSTDLDGYEKIANSIQKVLKKIKIIN